MAISGGDGSIILTTKVDETGLNKGVKGLKNSVKSMSSAFSGLGATIAAAFSIRAISAFIKESNELYKIQMQNEVKLATVMRQRMKATDEQIQQVLDLTAAEQARGILGDEIQLAGLQQLATFASQKETIEALLPAMNNLIAQQYGYEASTESARNAANLMGKVLQGQTGALTRVGITFTAAEEAALKTGNEMERAAVLAQVITNNVGEMNQALAKTDVGRQKQLANTFGDIKEQFGAAFTQLSILFLPALQFLANVLATIAQLARAAAQAIANMFGKEVAEPAQSTQSSISGSVGGMEDLADATKKAGKEAKKVKAQFDDIQILSSGAGGGGGGGGAGDAMGGIASGGATGTGFDFGIQGQVGEISSAMALIMGIAGEALIAIGLLLLFYGQIMWGIGFIITGAVAFAVAAASASQSDITQGVVGVLTTIMGIAGGALLALGIILLWLGGVVGKGVAIGMIIAGGALIVSAVATKAAFAPNDIKGWLATILGIAAGALLALGIILCMVGSVAHGVAMIIAGSASLITAAVLNYDAITNSVTEFFKKNAGLVVGISLALLVLGIVLCVCGVVTPLSIGLIVAGATGLVTEVTLNWTTIKDSVSKFLKENAGLIVGVSLALLVLGIILCCTGVALPLGIGLIVVGAVGLAAEVALNWDFIKDKAVEIFNNIMDWVKTWGLLILGIILVVSGVGIPLGIALMKKGGANLTEAQDPLWTAIVDRVKEAWEAIKLYWNTHIAKWFTKEHWAELGKKMINGLIQKVVEGLNKLIKKINSFGFDLPDVLGGGHVGFNIPTITPPQLAMGTVVPPNRKFLAMLGDNTKEHEIVSPVSTMKQAFTEAMIELGGNFGGGNTEVVLEIDGREFGRAVVEQGNRENRRIGTRLVIA